MDSGDFKKMASRDFVIAAEIAAETVETAETATETPETLTEDEYYKSLFDDNGDIFYSYHGSELMTQYEYNIDYLNQNGIVESNKDSFSTYDLAFNNAVFMASCLLDQKDPIRVSKILQCVIQVHVIEKLNSSGESYLLDLTNTQNF